MLWLPEIALAWSLNVPPGTPATHTPIGMWYLHPTVGTDLGGNNLGFTVPAGAPGASLRNQLTQFGFASVGGSPLTDEGTITMDDGNTYVIQSTTHLKSRGLGFILQFRTVGISITASNTFSQRSNDWTPVTSVSSTQCPTSWLKVNYGGNITSTFNVILNVDIRIHWIRLAGIDTSGNLIDVVSGPDNTRIFNLRLKTGANGGCDNISGGPPQTNQVLWNHWQSVHTYRAPVQTCTTPPGESLINLGMHWQGDFTGTGYTTPPETFTFIINCPEGYNAIRYWVGSPHRVPGDPDGVVRLNPASTASGVAVKIWDGPGNSALPLKFGAANTYATPGYVVNKGLWLDPSNPGGDDPVLATQEGLWVKRGTSSQGAAQNYGQPRQDYLITLKAALIQTAPTVTPGPFKTHILVYLVYK